MKPGVWEQACALGMHQHEAEIRPFAEWLSARDLCHVMEIGTLHGGTMALWAGISTGTALSVDLPDGEFGGQHHRLDDKAMRARNLKLEALFPGRFVGILGNSHQFSTIYAARNVLPYSSVDLLFIDGDHTYEGVRSDFHAYSPLVRRGGIVAFHDILDTPLHRKANCRVDLLWNELKTQYKTHEFCAFKDYGGIGALEMP